MKKPVGRESKDAASLCMAEWIDRKMRRRGLTIKDMSRISGLPETTIGYALAGRRVSKKSFYLALKKFFRVNRGHRRTSSKGSVAP